MMNVISHATCAVRLRGGYFGRNLISLNYYLFSLVPLTHVESIQDLMFLLEFKMNQREPDILKMEWWVARKRIKQYEGYTKEFLKTIEEGLKGLTGGRTLT